jgi:hypothetical protein
VARRASWSRIIITSGCVTAVGFAILATQRSACFVTPPLCADGPRCTWKNLQNDSRIERDTPERMGTFRPNQAAKTGAKRGTKMGFFSERESRVRQLIQSPALTEDEKVEAIIGICMECNIIGAMEQESGAPSGDLFGELTENAYRIEPLMEKARIITEVTDGDEDEDEAEDAEVS